MLGKGAAFGALVVVVLFGCGHVDVDDDDEREVTRNSTFLYRTKSSQCPKADTIEDSNQYYEDVKFLEGWHQKLPPLCYYPLVVKARGDQDKRCDRKTAFRTLAEVRATEERVFLPSLTGFNQLPSGEGVDLSKTDVVCTSDQGEVLVTQAEAGAEKCPEKTAAEPNLRETHEVLPLLISDKREDAQYCSYKIESIPPAPSNGGCGRTPISP